MKKKFLAALLSLCMVIALLPVTALADDPVSVATVFGSDYLDKMKSDGDSVPNVKAYATQTAENGTKTGDVLHVTITLTKPENIHPAEVAGTPVDGVGLKGIGGKFTARWVPAFIPKPSGWEAKYGQFAGKYSGWQTLTATRLADEPGDYEMDWFQAGYPGYYLAEYTKTDGQNSATVKVCYDVEFAGTWRDPAPPTLTAKATTDNKISVEVKNAGDKTLKVYYAKDKTYAEGSPTPSDVNNGSAESGDLDDGTYTLLLVDTSSTGEGVLGELLGITEVTLPAPVVAPPNAVDYPEFGQTSQESLNKGPWKAITLTPAENNTIKVKAESVQKHASTGSAPAGYWVGVGVAKAADDDNEKELYGQGWVESGSTASSAAASSRAIKPDGYYEVNGKTYATFYFNLGNAENKKVGYIKAGSVVYTVDFTDSTLASSDATLSALTYQVAGGEVTEITDLDNENGIDVVLPYGTEANATITVTGTPTDSANASVNVEPSTITLSDAGTATATVKVVAEDKTEKTYTINFTTDSRPLSNDATLSALSYKIGDDTAPVEIEGFAPGTTSYTVKLPADTPDGTKITLEYTLPTGATATKIDATLTNGTGTAKIIVTAESGTTNTYTVNFTTDGQPSNVAALRELRYKIGNNPAVPVPGFAADAADGTSFNVELPADTAANAKITLEGTPDQNAIVTVNNGVTLENGTGTASITVVSQDGNANKTYKVIFTTAKTEEPEPTVAKPVVDTEGLTGVTEEQKTQVSESAGSLEVKSSDGSNPLNEALNDTEAVAELLEKAAVADKAQVATQLNGLPEITGATADDVVPVVVTCMKIKVEEYVPNPDKGGSPKLKMRIEPKMMVVFTTAAVANGDEAIEAGKNAVKLPGSEEKDVTLPKNKKVEIKITLPAEFVTAVKGAQIYVGHKTGGKNFEYMGELGSGNAFSFTNPHGFSPFEFTTETTSGAWIDKVGYKDLSSALDEVDDKGTIEVVNADTSGSTTRTNLTGKSFTIVKDGAPWSGKVTINGVTYTPDANGKVTVTAQSGADKPNGTDKPGGSSGGGGGGSSKPSIKPGETAPNAPTAPTAPTSGTAGFSDVASGAWYAPSVAYVVERNIMNGTGNGNFAPDAPTTRAMIMTMLARLNGVDTNGGSVWYEKGMQWAKEQGVSDGSNPNGNVTREQLVTMLYRYMNSPEATGDLSGFADAAAVSDWAADAMKWAVANGLIQGSNGAINPTGNATRAEVATILMRFCESFSV